MALTKALNSKVNIKQYSNADAPIQPRQPVIARYSADSTGSQTVVNLPWAVDTINAQDGFFISVDGKVLTLGSANDYTMTSIDSLGFSSQVTLNSAITAGLNIQAWKMGLKKETEFAQDQRFVNVYDYLDKSFQGWVDQSQLMTATTATGSPSSGTFHSTVVGRTAIPDLRQDIKSRIGIERIMTQSISQIQNEFGPNGEPVFGALNDSNGSIRFVGNWASASSTNGNFVATPNSGTGNDFVEVTFYGTGLNILVLITASARDLRATVDGGTEGSNFFPSPASSVLNTQSYSANQILPVVSGLSLGVHTVKIRSASTSFGAIVYGFELLNDSSSVKTNIGVAYNQGKKITTSSQDSTSYTSGVTGTRGGRTVVYQNTDGTIGRSFQAVNVSQANLASADHTNEEVSRSYHFREFTAGRADDFGKAVNGTIQNLAFTLDDGTTTLLGNQVRALDFGVGGGDGLFTQDGTSNSITFTFVGTGLDVYTTFATSTGYTVRIDGTTIAGVFGNGANNNIKKVVSGLPYGTHTVKFTNNNAAGTGPVLASFIVYIPKKPLIPSGAIELADYNVMADYSNDTVGASIATDIGVSSGTLFKAAVREAVYVGTYPAITLNVNFLGGVFTVTSTNGDYVEYTFWGTGIEHRTYYGSTSTYGITYLIDGIALNAGANAGSTVSLHSPTATLGSLTISAAGVVSGTSGAGGAGHASKVRISGLPLGRHTLRVTRDSITGGDVNMYTSGFSVITPIHSPKSNIYADIQNTLPVGSCGISDNRKLTPIKELVPIQKAWAQAVGVFNSPTTTLTAYVPLADMSCTVKTSGNSRLRVSFSCQWFNATAGDTPSFQIFVNGIAAGITASAGTTQSGSPQNLATIPGTIIPIAAGVHKVDIYWKTSTGTLIANQFQRILTVEEL